MAKYTRWSPLLVIMMSKELKAEFFADDEEDFDAGWDLFETVHPDKAEALYLLLAPKLKEIEEYMEYQRVMQVFLARGEEGKRDAAMATVNYRAKQLNW